MKRGKPVVRALPQLRGVASDRGRPAV